MADPRLSPADPTAPIHVAHLVYQFSTGGLENVITQLVNGLPPSRFRHSIIAVTSIDPTYARRIAREDVQFHALHKGPGQPFKLYPRCMRLLRQLRPDVLHSCGLAALDFVPAAALAGVARRVHAEHGWSVEDPGGHNRKNQWVRRFYRPWVTDYVAVSAEIASYLADRIAVPAARLNLIENGVDLARYHPPASTAAASAVPDFPFDRSRHFIVGTVARLEAVKNHALLLDAVAAARQQDPALRDRLRLVLIGDGPLRATLFARAQALGLNDTIWWAGNRNDVPDLLRNLHAFALCSLAEGTSCALQEALATGLDTIATDVGGNRQLLAPGNLGTLVDSGDVQALTTALLRCARAPRNPAEVRRQAVSRFSAADTLDRYRRLFERPNGL